MDEVLPPVQWLILDNLRLGLPLDASIPPEFVPDALAWCKERGFVREWGGPMPWGGIEPAELRITRKGEIALRLSLREQEGA